MSTKSGIPKGAAIAIDDMLENCAKIEPGNEVLILAHIDGLYGSDNLVDEEAVSWIQSAVQAHGANASVLWIDETSKIHAWRFPPVVKAAMSACDILINHSFDLVIEEITELLAYIMEHKIKMVRNFATTAPLLCTAWAQTPHELVSELRYQASAPFKHGNPFQLTDDNGTHLEGIVVDYETRTEVPGSAYSLRRHDAGYYLPFPEWMHPPVRIQKTTGTFIFNSMLSWWSRYIGISPYFYKPIRLTIDDNRINKIEGGDEADALVRFLDSMREYIGDGVYDLNTIHFGIHPQAFIGAHQCPNLIYRRVIEHSNTCNIHVHIGAPPATPTYPYWMHCTGDIRTATFRVGDTLVHDRGHLTFLDHPAVLAIGDKYPSRPGVKPEPWSY